MKIDHIGIVVRDVNMAKNVYENLLNCEIMGEEILEDRGLKVLFVKVGEVRIELIQPIREDSEVSKFLEKRGEGIHHIAFEVENIEETLKKAKDMKLKLINEEPKKGAHNTLVAFLHPKSTNGVLMELVQKVKD